MSKFRERHFIPVEILINTRNNSATNPRKEAAIMKRIISAAILTLILEGPAFGLSDKKYTSMKKSSKAFRVNVNFHS